MSLRNWIVEVNDHEEDPRPYGPYSQATALSIAASFNKARDRAAARDPEDERVLNLQAIAYPIGNLNITALRKEYDL